MKLFVFPSILFAAFLCSAAAAQTSPPPVAVDRPAAKKWESAEGGYKVSFPATPRSSVKSLESSFGPTNFYNTELSTAFAYYSVLYFDFPTAITERFDLDTRFDNMRDEQVKRLSARVTEDSEFMFGTYYGRANVFETERETVTMRSFVAGPRLYMMFIVTKGRQSTLPKAAAAANTKRIDAFLSSFEVTKLPEAKAAQVNLPADFQITAGPTSFSSAYLGFSFTPPAGWTLSSTEESELVLELGKDSIRRTDSRLADYVSNENTRVLGMYTKSDLATTVPSALMMIIAERTPYPNFTAAAVASTYAKSYLDKNEKIVKPVTPVTLGGREFAWIETMDSATKLYNRFYVANMKGIAVEFVIIYSKSADLEPILRSLQTMKVSEN